MNAINTEAERLDGRPHETNGSAEELAHSYTRLHSILEAIPDQVLTLNRDWTVTYANGRALESFPDLKLGAEYWRCCPFVLGTPAEQHHRDAMAGRSEVCYDSVYAPLGTCFRVKVYPVKDGLAIFFNEITEQKIAEDERALERLLREKRIEALSLMAGGLAHEISNPLAIIHGWAHDLKSMASEEALLSSPEVGSLCDKILKTTSRATNILRGLRAFAHEATHDPMELASIATIVDQALEFQESRFARHGVEIRTKLQPDIPLFRCREVQVGQILTNLLNNAFDAIVQSDGEQRWVELRATASASEVQIEVIDSGPGIDDQMRPHLMEPFFTTKELGLGMGVGLSLSRAIAQDHGGMLMLVKETKHTCFRLSLPVGSGARPHDGRALDREAT